MQVKRVVSLLIAVCLFSLMTEAQFQLFHETPAVKLGISQAPRLGLTVKRVAFGRSGGHCADIATELVESVIMPDFQKQSLDVIERGALDQILSEHNFNQSEYADSSSAARLGKILGPSAMIIVNANVCTSSKDPLFEDKYGKRTFISKTRFALEGSLRVVDLTTGKVIGSESFSAKPDKSNSSAEGQPEFPPEDELRGFALKEAGSQIHAMFFPSQLDKEEMFYDDKECGMKQVYDILHNGDRAGALKIMDNNLQQCKSTPQKKERTVLRASYDAGLLHCMNDDFDGALPLFTAAQQGKGAEAVTTAMADCNLAQQGKASVARYLDKLAQVPEPGAIGAKHAHAEESKSAGASSAAGAGAGASSDSVEGRLKKLDGLYKRGLINKKEYDERRAAILKEI